jgi:sugar lactone lactonase YvrE
MMYNDNVLGRLIRVDPEGQLHVVLTDLDDPNGMTVDPCGNVYITDEGAGQVLRVDPYTGDYSVLVEGLPGANDLTFNVDYTRLYVDSFNEEDKTIYYLDIDIETGEHDELTAWVTDLGSGFHDGLRVDACDNVYVCDYCCHGSCSDTCIYRISADGIVEPQLVIDPPSVGMYIPNFEWGGGIGGWDSKTLFLPHGWVHYVYRIYIGVPSKPTVFP